MKGLEPEDLKREDISPAHQKMLDECLALLKVSRDTMSTFYDTSDKNEEIYRGFLVPDKEDLAARDRKEPTKMVVPLSYAQVKTFEAFCHSLYTQRERIFELVGMSEADHKPAKIAEALLARDLMANKFETILSQFLKDSARFGLGVMKVSWVREQRVVSETQQVGGVSVFGFNFLPKREEIVKKKVTTYLGNRLVSVSPYRFFPDTRLPISRFQEGEFCASEDDYSQVTLRRLESDGLVHGIDYVPVITHDVLDRRGRTEDVTSFLTTTPFASAKGPFLITEMQRTLVPRLWSVDDERLGDEDYPVKYLIWIANDHRIVRFEPLDYPHGEYTYVVGEYDPDLLRVTNQGLSDTIDQLQSVISWFISSRITSVRKVISNFLIVDPSGIEMSDLEARRPVIRLKSEAQRQGGVDRWLKQLNVNDVTTNHLTDAQFLQQIVQIVTGIGDNVMGQFYRGRRSATESRNVGMGAASRLKLVALLLFRTALEPLARQMLANLRAGLDEATFVRIVGLGDADPGFLKATRDDMVGEYEFEVFDGTLPSERALLAQTLEEILVELVRQPQSALALQLDPRAMMLEAMQLRGIRNPTRFTLKTAPQPNVNTQPMA